MVADPEFRAYYVQNTRNCRNKQKASGTYTERRNAEMRKARQRIEVRIVQNLRSRVHGAVRKGYKSSQTMELVGCNYDSLLSHLENQFKDGMSWENYGFYGWHIDHIRPCASFDLTDPKQQRECFHFSNLQPLWAEDNLRKSDHWNLEA